MTTLDRAVKRRHDNTRTKYIMAVHYPIEQPGGGSVGLHKTTPTRSLVRARYVRRVFWAGLHEVALHQRQQLSLKLGVAPVQGSREQPTAWSASHQNLAQKTELARGACKLQRWHTGVAGHLMQEELCPIHSVLALQQPPSPPPPSALCPSIGPCQIKNE